MLHSKDKFWRIGPPDYNSDYEDFNINGSLEHPFSIPGVQCHVCGETWGGSRILPYECPLDMRERQQLRNSYPISLKDQKSLQKEVLVTLEEQGISVLELFPGDTFQPCYLDIPSKPRADFLWASLGSLVVSERIRSFLIEHCPDDIVSCDVALRKIGKLKVELPAPIPSSGESADIINEVDITPSCSDIGPYFEICIQKESGWPPGGKPGKICSGCGRPHMVSSTREIRLTDDMWKGDQIFFLATTLYIIITDDLKRMIENLKPTNVVFSEV